MATEIVKGFFVFEGPHNAMMIGYASDRRFKVTLVTDRHSAPLPGSEELGTFDTTAGTFQPYLGFSGEATLAYHQDRAITACARESDPEAGEYRRPAGRCAFATDPYGKADRQPGMKTKSKYARKHGKRKCRAP